MRRRPAAPVLLLLAALLALALAPPAGAATATARVIGGTTATPADAPWQALVLPYGYLCGGAILDETHIVTAAHCVYDPDSFQVDDPASVGVRVGIVDRMAAGGQSATVSAIAIYPYYSPDLESGDVAVLTLASPLALGSTVQPIALTAPGWKPVDFATNLQLSGWGSTVARSPDLTAANAVASPVLMVAKTIQSTSACSHVYESFNPDMLLCAGQAGQDACQGDSGGPLAFDDGQAGWKLAGIVTGGAGCGWDGYPGFYARVSQPGINDFLVKRGAGSELAAPVFTRAPALVGDPVVGTTLTCDHGTASNAYASYATIYENGAIAVRDDWISLRATDVGATITCSVTASGLKGTVKAVSAPVVVRAAPVSTAPRTAPPVSPYAPRPDTRAPVAKVLRAACSRGVCTIDVRVEDPSPSAGIKGVEARVETPYRTTCRVKGRRRRCTKTAIARLRGAITPAVGVYKLVTPHLRAGRHRFVLVALDTAGHRQAHPTTFTRTTR